MNLRRALAVAAGVVVGAAGVAGVSSPASAAPPFVPPTGCSIQTVNTGNHLTAVGGGGRASDVIHSDATQIQAWELFRFTCGQALVPNVLSFDDRSARDAIVAAGLTVGRVAFDTHCYNPAGTVELQNPIGGARVPWGTAVNLREDAPGCTGR